MHALPQFSDEEITLLGTCFYVLMCSQQDGEEDRTQALLESVHVLMWGDDNKLSPLAKRVHEKLLAVRVASVGHYDALTGKGESNEGDD